MKKQSKLKLTACMVSLFVGILCIALSKGAKVGVSVGLLFVAVGLVVFVFFNNERADRIVQECEQEIQACYAELDKLDGKTSQEEREQYSQLQKHMTTQIKLQKQQKKGKPRVQIMFILFAFFLVVIAFGKLFN